MSHNHGTEETSIEALIEKQRRLACSGNPFERVFCSLVVAATAQAEARSLPNETVGQLMFDHVWNVIDVSSPEMAICQVATERLLNSSSVVKTTRENHNR